MVLSYQLGISIAYVVSMPMEEALNLSGYHRYSGSMLVFTVGVALIVALDALNAEPVKTKQQRAMACLAVLACALPVFPERTRINTLFNHSYHQELYEDTDRYLLNQAMSKYSLPEGANYIIYTENNRDYLWHLGRYDLWVADPTTIDSLDRGDLGELIADNDYFVLLHNTETAREKLKEFGYEVLDDNEPAAIKLH